MECGLQRFREAQEEAYPRALLEIRSGKKQSHWIWYIFPQISGLGQSMTARYYEIRDKAEAIAYWQDPILSARMKEITEALLKLDGSIQQIMGFPDDLKLCSSMTLFYSISREPVFKAVLDKFFDGKMDEYTVWKLREGETRYV